MLSPVAAAPMAVPMSRAMMEGPLENDHDDQEENNSTYSAELHVEGIEDHCNEEERITEAEKNEHVQKQLMVTRLLCFLKLMFELVVRIVIHLSYSSNFDSEEHLKHKQVHLLIHSVTISGGSAVFED